MPSCLPGQAEPYGVWRITLGEEGKAVEQVSDWAGGRTEAPRENEAKLADGLPAHPLIGPSIGSSCMWIKLHREELLLE